MRNLDKLTRDTNLKSLAYPIVMIFIISGCNNKKINYRLDISILADNNIIESSGVIRTIWYDQSYLPGLANGIAWYPQAYGQALPIDLGKYGLLFVLLRGDGFHKESSYDESSLLENIIIGKQPPQMTEEQTLTLAANYKGSVDIPCKMLPMLVRFRDITNPLTVKKVDPCNIGESLNTAIKFLHATLSITKKAPTIGIDQWLPWLKNLKGGYLTGQHGSSERLPGELNAGDFKM